MAIQGNLQKPIKTLTQKKKEKKSQGDHLLQFRDKKRHNGNERPVMLCFHDQRKNQLSYIKECTAVAVVYASSWA